MHNDYRRASLWVWVTGGALTLLMGCCGLSLSVVAVTPMDELAKAAGPAISPAQLEQITPDSAAAHTLQSWW
ncbi:MAG: hypothetical protein HC898_10835, partial [Phycisphaerales bacterium]|nr:hypothetical protein [Phycisphaerales bacterium]